MKINLLNKRSKQGANHLPAEQVGAIAKHDSAESNSTISEHTDYIPNGKTSQEITPPESTQPNAGSTNTEKIESDGARYASPIKHRSTNTCKNCNTIINSTEDDCYQCKTFYGKGQPQGQTIIIKEESGSGCWGCLIITILIIILLPLILEFIGWISLGAILARS